MSEETPTYGGRARPPLDLFRLGHQAADDFLKDALEAFDKDLRAAGLEDGSREHRMRGAEQFADWLRGVPRRKGQTTGRKSGTLGG